MKHTLLIGVTSALFFLSCEEWSYKESQPGEVKVAIRINTIAEQEIEITKNYYGRLKFGRQMTHIAESSGRVENMSLVPGQRVKRGQQLAWFPPINHHLQINQLQIAIDELTRNYNRQQELNNKGAVASNSVDELKTQLDIQKKVLDHLRGINQVTAPFDGVITEVYVRDGEEVVPGMQVFSMADDSKLYVEFYIPDKNVDQIKPGHSAKLKDTRLDEMNGTVIHKAMEMDLSRNAFRALASFDHPGISNVGQIVELVVPLELIPKAIVIPESCLKQQGNSQYVYLVKDGLVKKQMVKTGKRKGTEIHIKSGLVAGDLLVTAGMDKLRDGTAIRITE